MMMRLLPVRRLFSPKLQHCMSSNSAAYAGDGKTTVRILNDDEPHINLVSAYSSHGFRLSNALFVAGSIILFPTHIFSWNIKRGADITMDSLIVFDLIVPKTKILVIGYGQQGEKYDPSIPMHLKKRGISCEMLPTPNAVTTFNYLAADGLHVGGAFVPVRDEVIQTPRDTEALFGQDEMLRESRVETPYGYQRETIDDLYEQAKEFKGTKKPDLKSRAKKNTET